MQSRVTKVDYILWTVITVYIGVIYATLSIVSEVRKFLAERYGPDIFDNIAWVFAAAGVGLFFYVLIAFRGRRRLITFAALIIIGIVYVWYLSTLHYAVEKIHFIQYGLLGILFAHAITRHVHNWVGIFMAVAAVYWAGLGDEAIQWALPGRVGEIRDSITNLFSGLLGSAVYFSLVKNKRIRLFIPPAHARFMIVTLGLTTVFTTLFLVTVHGFGAIIERGDPGRIYSSFSENRLAEINGYVPVSGREMRVYTNEALRHLHQREFYFYNEFMARNGSYYLMYDRSFFENRVLETWYGRFLLEHSESRCSRLLKTIDKETASMTENPVLWPDSVRNRMKRLAGDTSRMHTSRVKSTIITSYHARDLYFFSALLLIVFISCFFMITKKESIPE
ncbi:MAG: hypothetical protein GF401_20365 [Chitinivibrionales bacterium]|nr:hypothetical protein [Chitinivibrionales bacterium]